MSRRLAAIVLSAVLVAPAGTSFAQNRSYDLWDSPTGGEEIVLNGKLDMSGTTGGVGRSPAWEYGDDRGRVFFVGSDFDSFNDRRLGALRIRNGNGTFRSRSFVIGGGGIGISSGRGSFSNRSSFSRSFSVRGGGRRR